MESPGNASIAVGGMRTLASQKETGGQTQRREKAGEEEASNPTLTLIAVFEEQEPLHKIESPSGNPADRQSPDAFETEVAAQLAAFKPIGGEIEVTPSALKLDREVKEATQHALVSAHSVFLSWDPGQNMATGCPPQNGEMWLAVEAVSMALLGVRPGCAVWSTLRACLGEEWEWVVRSCSTCVPGVPPVRVFVKCQPLNPGPSSLFPIQLL
ncbi:hypothetical protein P7K49_013764 [Saguinus oedipus]|uniref:Uncharacterized protein n=1 Tax=Saguinus oedipus TaxID=9490 RepID=A0ABQ9VGV3_SAGOE|nr:hypothetical protein P7K49_013764 [Saguinus oedipus]